MGGHKPILLKIAPDLSEEALDEIAEVIKASEIDGVIATNTTISRSGLNTKPENLNKIGEGGLSGKPLKEKATKVIQRMRALLGNDYLIIGVGGIHGKDDAIEKIQAGADLVQLYTGFIYEGPGLVKEINQAVIQHKRQTSVGS